LSCAECEDSKKTFTISELLTKHQQDEIFDADNQKDLEGNICVSKLKTSRQITIEVDTKVTSCIVTLKRHRFQNGMATGEKIKNGITPDPILTFSNAIFVLAGCVLHVGSAKGGHYVYVSYDTHQTPSTIADDSRVYNASVGVTNTIHTDGYMFLYKRVQEETSGKGANKGGGRTITQKRQKREQRQQRANRHGGSRREKRSRF
jgi:ubiquitin C-terminal hydrolase